ncbi:inositol 2-dehydrogenase [Pelomyxa schiedti]|nr:inositol 2-dehydrogenase [Pelomyxa schiedti]
MASTTSTTTTTLTPVRLCQIGAGRIGTFRLGLFSRSPHVRCVAVVESDRGNEVWANSGKPGHPTAFAALEDVNVQFDAVWISCPTKYHPAMIEKAVNRTRFVYCEKPIAYTAAQVKQCYAMCKARGVELLCGWMRRSDQGYSALYKTVLTKPVDVCALHLVSNDFPHMAPAFLKTLGSIFQDLMCHDFNLACMFMKEEMPVSIEAHGKDSTGVGIFTSATCILQYTGGRFVYMEATRYGDGKYENYARVYNNTGNTLETGKEEVHHTFMDRYLAAFSSEVEYFSRVVRGENIPRKSTERSCVATAVLVDLAEKSATSGKRVFLTAKHRNGLSKL